MDCDFLSLVFSSDLSQNEDRILLKRFYEKYTTEFHIFSSAEFLQ